MNYRKRLSNGYVRAIDIYLKYVDRLFAQLSIASAKIKKNITVLPDLATKHLFKITMIIFFVVFLIFFAS